MESKDSIFIPQKEKESLEIQVIDYMLIERIERPQNFIEDGDKFDLLRTPRRRNMIEEVNDIKIKPLKTKRKFIKSKSWWFLFLFSIIIIYILKWLNPVFSGDINNPQTTNWIKIISIKEKTIPFAIDKLEIILKEDEKEGEEKDDNNKIVLRKKIF